ncbi:MAG: DUF6266 family protein [Daejeonella sp.]|uniref:DUF6266 family protein n=1 Tax=Daejeonella sp. TaxID=2805397 RepID=UPI0033486AB2
MGRLINGPNGPFIGKAGSYIGYVVNGVGYIKGNYRRRTKAPTEDEAFNREKFAVAQRYLRPLINYVRPGFKGYNPRFQGFAAAKSYLMRNALKVIDRKIVIDPALVKICFGNLHLPDNIKCEFQEPNLMRVSWDPSGIGASDQAMVLFHNSEAGHPYGNVYGNYRKSGEENILVENSHGTTLHGYLAFITEDRSRQSDTVYLGKFEF